jgi:hypothetical protein
MNKTLWLAMGTSFALSLTAIAQSGMSGSASTSPGTNTTSGSSNTSDDQGSMSGGTMTDDMGRTDSDQSRVPATAPDTASKTTEDQQAMKDMSPKEVCQKLVDSHKDQAKHTKQMDQWVMTDKMTASKSARKSADSHNWIKQEISKASCESETVAGDHAFVMTKSGDRERFIPFVKTAGQWKLDMQAYRTLYRMDSRTPASK